MKSLKLMFLSAALASTFAAAAKAQVDPGGARVTDRQSKRRVTPPPPAEPEYRELRCRGYSAMRIQVGEGRSTTAGEQMMHMEVTIDPVSKPTDQWASNLQPGQCAFSDWTVPGAMPSLIEQEIVAFAQLIQKRNGSPIDTSPTAAEHFPDAQNVPQYLKDPGHYWSFFVKNNGQGYFDASYGRFWKPSKVSPVETVAKEKDSRLQGALNPRSSTIKEQDPRSRGVLNSRSSTTTDPKRTNIPVLNSILVQIKYRKEYGYGQRLDGLTADGLNNGPTGPTSCGAFSISAVPSGPGRPRGGPFRMSDPDFVMRESNGYYVCNFVFDDLPLHQEIRVLANVTNDPFWATAAWEGGSEAQPAAGQHRGIQDGNVSVTLTEAQPRVTLIFEMIYASPPLR